MHDPISCLLVALNRHRTSPGSATLTEATVQGQHRITNSLLRLCCRSHLPIAREICVAAIIPQAHCFPMQKPPIPRCRLQRMTDGMAEVQHPPQPALALIRRNDSAFSLTDSAMTHSRSPHSGATPSRHSSRHAEQLWLSNHSALQSFVQTSAEFTLRQRRQNVRINQHHPRLMKCSKQILRRRADLLLSSRRSKHPPGPAP